MATTAAVSVIDAIAEAFDMTLKQFAKFTQVSEDALLKARGGELHPATAHFLSEKLGVSELLFRRSAGSVGTLLEAFHVIDPRARVRLADKVATTREALYRVYGTIYPPINRPFPNLDLLLDEYDRSGAATLVPFVAYVRQRLEDDYILVFSHPLRTDDYSAILYVPDKHDDPYSYLIVDEEPNCHPITNALYQWYDVLRILARVRDWKIDTRERAVYLERATNGYDERVNSRLAESVSVYSRYTYERVQPTDALALADHYRLLAIVASLRNGLSPAAIADYFGRKSAQASPTDTENAARSLADRNAVDDLVTYIVERELVPSEYDWTIPSYPALLKQAALTAGVEDDLDGYTALTLLNINGFEMTTLLEQIELLGLNNNIDSLE